MAQAYHARAPSLCTGVIKLISTEQPVNTPYGAVQRTSPNQRTINIGSRCNKLD